jgi:CTD nuclear envelope phosphatase 1
MHERPVESGIDMDSKDSEPEIKQTAPLCPPSPSSLSSYFFRIHRPIEDQPSIVSPKQEPEPPLLPPSTTLEVQLSAEASRTPTPVPSSRKAPFQLPPKTLVLDLDETLIHSTSRPLDSLGASGSGLLGLNSFGRRNQGAGHMVEVVLGGRSTLYHVYKRPFVDFFLRTVCC